ncbi:hypothetical protein R1sor_020223 [Riccia sorocarpa]|uniref:Uncharacterized protein n=1 Tax=Riccia sorocarpa TaxID=122646 RepID=A0ABD3IFF7_9MARC
MEEFQGEMRDVQEQLWQAGKYGTVGLVVLTTLPVFLPSMLVLSALFFTFLLPLVCGVAGCFYFLKYVAMVYHFRSGIRSHRPSSAWGVSCVRRYAIFRSGIFLLLEFFRKDTDQIDLLETDHEYDSIRLADNKKPRGRSRGRRVKPETSTRTEQFESREQEFPNGEATVVFQTQADREGKVVETVFVHSGGCNASEMIRFIFSGERDDLGVASVRRE